MFFSVSLTKSVQYKNSINLWTHIIGKQSLSLQNFSFLALLGIFFLMYSFYIFDCAAKIMVSRLHFLWTVLPSYCRNWGVAVGVLLLLAFENNNHSFRLKLLELQLNSRGSAFLLTPVMYLKGNNSRYIKWKILRYSFLYLLEICCSSYQIPIFVCVLL